MSHFYPGIVAIKIGTGGALSPRISARYWRLDNLVYESSSTQIRGLYLVTKDVTGWTKLNPLSITNDTGDVTSVFNDNGTISGVIDAVTFFELDMGVSVAPEQLIVAGHEWDLDHIQTADISYSHDGITWTKVSEFRAYDETGDGRVRVIYDGTHQPSRTIRPPDGQALITSSHVGIVSGRRSDAMTIPRGEIIVLSGRHPAGVAIVTGNLYVITTPV